MTTHQDYKSPLISGACRKCKRPLRFSVRRGRVVKCACEKVLLLKITDRERKSRLNFG